MIKPINQRSLTQNLVNNDSQVRRSRLETMFDILKTIASGTERPTHIMYRANLSWKVMQLYMRNLETQGMVEPIDEQGRRIYRLTEKGFRLLEQFNSVRDGLLLQNAN